MQIEFHNGFPSQARCRLFLQFAHAGVVRTAAFTVEIRPSAARLHRVFRRR